MNFAPLQYQSGRIKAFNPSDSGITKGDALEFEADGSVSQADDATKEVKFVAMQDYDGLDGEDHLLAVSTESVEFVAQCADDTDDDQVGKVCNLTAEGLVDNAGDDGDVFRITKVLGTSENKEVRGYFLDRVSKENE